MAEERLQKVLARAGVASRRAAEDLIVNGRVKVNGRIVSELGVRVDGRESRIEVDGRRIVAEPLVYVVLHKPRAVMCTLSDPEGRKTIADLLRGIGVRLIPVGRLDYHTSGALLCTNDGDFAGKLLHPRGGVPKEYVAKVQGSVLDTGLENWKQSIEIEGRATRPAEVRLLRYEGDKTWLSILLREGRNRQVRRLGEATGFPVLRLARISHAGITTEGLRPGQWRYLTRDELAELKKNYGVPKRVKAAVAPVAPPTRAALRLSKKKAHTRPERRAPEGRFERPAEARPARGAAEGRLERPTRGRSSEARPGARSAEARPTRGRSSEARPGARSAEARPTRGRSSEARPGARSAEARRPRTRTSR
jgi:23S rRNA pseudouridine2605 synthase